MPSNQNDPYQTIQRVLLTILFLNWGVALAKIIYGSLSHCASMSADGFHSLSDGASNIIGLAGIHFAKQPIDKDHPYGHKKYETFFSLGIAFSLFLIGVGIIHQAIERLLTHTLPRIEIASFIIMLITMVINILVMRYEHKKGIALKSDILTSDAKHTRADIFTSLSVIITLIAIKLGFPIVDPIAAILIALFIIHAGAEIVRDSSRILCDTVAIVDEKKIEDVVLGVKGVKTCHKIRSRGREDDIHVDLHVQVNPDMHIEEAHNICYKIEESIKKNIPGIADVIVHMEPHHCPAKIKAPLR